MPLLLVFIKISSQAAWGSKVQRWRPPQPLYLLAKPLPWRFDTISCYISYDFLRPSSFSLNTNTLCQALVSQREILRLQLSVTLGVLPPWRRSCLPALLQFRLDLSSMLLETKYVILSHKVLKIEFGPPPTILGLFAPPKKRVIFGTFNIQQATNMRILCFHPQLLIK